MFLGAAGHSNEAYIGTRSGNVVRSRGLARVVEKIEWDRCGLFRLLGTPMKMCPNPDGIRDNACTQDPEVEMAFEEQPEGENCKACTVRDNKNAPRIRINRQAPQAWL